MRVYDEVGIKERWQYAPKPVNLRIVFVYLRSNQEDGKQEKREGETRD